MNENIKDICGSCTDFKLQITSSSEMKEERIAKVSESGVQGN